jgi:hypothetical protein
MAVAALYLFFMVAGMSEVFFIGLMAVAFVVALLAPVVMLGLLVFLLLRGRPWSEIRKWLWALGCGLGGLASAVALNAVFWVMLWLGSKEEDDNLGGEGALLLLFALPLIPAFFGVGAYVGWGWGSRGRTTDSGHSQPAS